jgi:hypothetical protein
MKRFWEWLFNKPKVQIPNRKNIDCLYCKNTGKIYHWEFGQFVKCCNCRN